VKHVSYKDLREVCTDLIVDLLELSC
jgi:hypothetical protein